jgi:hypothetical protein
MPRTVGIWIDHTKAVIVFASADRVTAKTVSPRLHKQHDARRRLRMPQPALDAAVALDPIRATQTRVFSRGSGSFEAQRRVQRPVCGDALVQWLRPVRNLRRAIVVATIVGPPMADANSWGERSDVSSPQSRWLNPRASCRARDAAPPTPI